MPIQSQSNKKCRRSILFWVFLLSAVPLTVLIIGYAAGYTFDLKTKKIKSTATLSIETTPKNAQIFLDQNEEAGTPFLKNNINPGTYNISIKKDNYHSWQKKIFLPEGKSTIFPDVILFEKDTTPALVEKTDHRSLRENFLALPADYYDNYQKNSFDTPQDLKYLPGHPALLIDPKKCNAYLINSLDKFDQKNTINNCLIDAVWNENRYLLYITKTELWVYDQEENTFTLLTRQSTPFISAVWDLQGDYIYFSNQNGIYALELDGRDHKQTWQLTTMPQASQLTVFDSIPNHLFFAVQENQYDLELYQK
ncbi:MAG: hypothetical protein A2458_01385 [Candidatus Kerfeldbacteria bacterium RIFOXYC2_FULL_38_9]|nr:MAG: hypothetical protein A2458_01385 [Candidatus Kerfeldbacteria bacterium RIFOXYC2_FULL_38_9]